MANPRLASETEADEAASGAAAPGAAFPLSVRVAILVALVVLAGHTALASRNLSGATPGEVVTLLLPLFIGCTLTLVLLIQTRKAEAASRA